MATTRASSPRPSRSRPRKSTAVSNRTAGLQRRAREKTACSLACTAALLSAPRLEQGTCAGERREESGAHRLCGEQGWAKEEHCLPWPFLGTSEELSIMGSTLAQTTGLQG